jgi:hypothetical protein
MTEVLQFPSPSSCSSTPCARLNPNDSSHQTTTSLITINNHDHSHFQIQQQEQEQEQEEKDQLSILTLLIATFRKSLIGCSSTGAAAGEISSSSSSSSMEIGWPSNVRHVAHVTFDRFHGFLGLPVEFEPEVPTRPPSARFISLLFYQFLLIA